MVKEMKLNDFVKIFYEAEMAGEKAANALIPTPMVVSEVGLDDKPYPGSQSYFIADGVCGFAWITIRPGNSAFANWLKKNNLAEKAYYGGVEIWVSKYGQCMQKKEAYAEAFAAVLREYGISARYGSRLD